MGCVSAHRESYWLLTAERKCDTMGVLSYADLEASFASKSRHLQSNVKRLPSPGLTPLPYSSAATAMMGGVVMSKRIPLTQGKFAIVDDADYESLSQYKWHATKPRHIWYAVRTIWQNGKRCHIYMHRVILNPSPGLQSDHINGDGLDNRRVNLRPCTRSQNLMNARKWAKCSSKWKGVYWQKQAQKWAAQIKAKGKVRHLGLFDSENEACYAYNIAACMYFGEFALLNEFPSITNR